MEQYFNFIKTSQQEQIDPWLAQVDAMYAAGKAAVPDEIYDRMIDIYTSRFGPRDVIGSKATHSEVKLPIAMMSLDKIMKAKALDLFTNKTQGEYIVMDKINGNSGLYQIQNNNGHTKISLYNRGDGTIGSDLSHLLDHLNLPIPDIQKGQTIWIKGELVIDKSDYEPYQADYKTNLSMINGLLNSLSADPQRLDLFRFIAFDLCANNQEWSIKESLDQLDQWGFITPEYKTETTEDMSISQLSEFYNKRKTEAPYDVDGLVITHIRPIKHQERLVRDNPKWAIAFKEYGDTAEATVTEVIWEASKHRVLKPKIKIEEVTINNFTIKSLTGFNAGWIVKNSVGPGSVLLITHNTIPHILGVINSTEASLPPEEQYPLESWEWNETDVDIVLSEDTDEIRIARIYEFFKQIGAKYFGEKTLAKFYAAGFDTVQKMLETTKEEFLSANIKGIGAGTIDRMQESLARALCTATLPQIMAGSTMFGHGFGVRRTKAILEVYPNILEWAETPTVEHIVDIEGFAEKTAEKFILGLPKFKAFLDDIPLLQQVVNGEYQPPASIKEELILKQVEIHQIQETSNNTGESVNGKAIVFTGFRDKSLQAKVEALGGVMKSGVSKKVDILVVGGKKGVGSAKEKKAISYGIPVLTLEEFKAKFVL